MSRIDGTTVVKRKPRQMIIDRIAALSRRNVVTGVVACVGLMATVAAFGFVQAQQWERARLDFEGRAMDTSGDVEQGIESYVDMLRSIQGLYAASREVEREEFREFVRGAFGRRPGVEVLGWNLRVPAAERDAAERTARAEGFPDFRITEEDASGAIVAAGPRQEYVVVYYLEPYEGHEVALGFDLLSEADRREAQIKARRSGEIVTTPQVARLQQRGPGLLVFAPVYRNNAPTGTPIEREENFIGTVTGLFRVSDMVGALLQGKRPDIDFRLYDRSAPAGAQLLHASGADESEQEEIATRSGLRRATTFLVGGRQWELEFVPTDRFLAGHQGPQSAAVLLAGFAMTALLTVYLVTLGRRAAHVERLVSERTAELSRANSMNRAILDSTSRGIAFLSPDRRLLDVNRRFGELFGVDAAAATDRTWAEFAGFVDRVLSDPDGFRRLVAGSAADPDREFTATVAQRWPENRELELYSAPVATADGQHAGRLYVFRDVTQEREVQRLKDEFASIVSHELRTPLNGVIGMTQLLLATVLTPKQSQYADALDQSAKTLLTLVDDILDFSKIEAGRLELENSTVDVPSLIDEVVDQFAPAARAKPLDLVSLFDNQLPRALSGDPGRLRQVLTNLVGNAVKFTERGAVIVRVAVHEDRPDGLVARFEVEDTGPGIAREDQERLFVPFSQIDRSLARMHGGSGLGLAISKRLVELMGGEIGIESEAGKGSTFWFTTRFLLGAQDIAPAPDIHASIRGLRVLTLEPNPAVRAGLREILAAWGLRVEEADDQAGGLARLRAAAADGDPFDLAIVDTRLEDHGALVGGIRSDVALSRTRVVLLVPFDAGQAGVPGTAPGADAVLQKPVRASRLLDILVQVFGPTAEPPALAKPEPLAPAGERRAGSTPGPLILVAEDSPINQQVASGMLENLGYRCEVVGSGTEAIAAAARKRYAAIFMDSQMPGKDGFGASAEIRSLEGHAHHTPIIAITANAMPEDRARCLAAGMDDYVSKPVRVEELAKVLARWVPSGNSGAAASTLSDLASVEALDARATTDVVDLGVIDALRGQRLPGRPDPVAELVTLFASETVANLGAIQRGVADGDARAIWRAAHSLRGNAAVVGAREVQALAAELEALGRSSDLAAAVELVGNLDAAVTRARSALSALSMGDVPQR